VTERSAISLLGRDFPELGPVGLVTNRLGGALAISRGRFPKPYPHVDPNEDAALLVHTRSGVMIAVADGFNGSAASELALEALSKSADLLVVEDTDAFDSAIREWVRTLTVELRRVAPSSTCLALIAVRDRACHVASFGDSSAFRASENEVLVGPTELPWPPGLAKPGLVDVPFTAHFAREAGERVAVVSDGITNFLRDPTRIPAWLAEAPDDTSAVRRIAEAALESGAGDNLAVVAYGDPGPRST
jgi:serine/threonine protein phosphatase PrpC